jgi:hypothetical protein
MWISRLIGEVTLAPMFTIGSRDLRLGDREPIISAVAYNDATKRGTVFPAEGKDGYYY